MNQLSQFATDVEGPDFGPLLGHADRSVPR